ncbi:MAG: PilZ domain-containing protein [Candidatus Omnitrophota bacterium]
MSMGHEKREFRRAGGSFIVYYSIVGASSEKNNITQTKNISEGGLLLTTDREINPGVVLKMKIVLPTAIEQVLLFGEVIESTKLKAGALYNTRVKFVDIKPGERAYIDKIVKLSSK